MNHSTVLLAVAAWEQYIESVLLEAFAKFDPGNAAPLHEQKRHGQRRGEIKTEIHKFGTPNAENTQRLFQTTLGIDPTTGWAMQLYGRTTWGTFTVAESRTRLNEILQVRHSAAHGHAIPKHSWNNTASIGKIEALRIMQFLKKLVNQTDSCLRRQMSSEFNIANAWSDEPTNVDFSSV